MVADVALAWVWREEEPASHPVGEEGQRGTPTLSLAGPQVEKDTLQHRGRYSLEFFLLDFL
jgi:hypothetical protein